MMRVGGGGVAMSFCKVCLSDIDNNKFASTP